MKLLSSGNPFSLMLDRQLLLNFRENDEPADGLLHWPLQGVYENALSFYRKYSFSLYATEEGVNWILSSFGFKRSLTLLANQTD